MNKPEYFYELACCNCPEKDRCLEQKEKKESLINTLFSYIENESNKITIGEIKNQIPTLTRCDVVLEKQLQRLKAENERLKAFKRECLKPVYLPDIEPEVINKYKQALEDVRECINVLTTVDNGFKGSMVEWKINKILNEVLKDE